MKQENSHIHGLNDLRAIAALAVIAHHIEVYKHRENDLSFLSGPLATLFLQLGHNAVLFFFSLSGFLITVLLLREKALTSDIDVKAFYIRRCSRILPLYYALLMVSFFIVPPISRLSLFEHEHYYLSLIEGIKFSSLWIFIAILPNLALKLGHRMVGISQSWSIGVEEQFYAIWPWVIKKIKVRYLPWLFLILIVVKISILNKIDSFTGNLIREFALEYMAAGALAGWLFFHDFLREQKTKQLVTGISIVLTIAVLFVDTESIAKGIFFSTLILGVANLRQDKGWLSSLGQKSYGIYMYHPLIMFILFAVFHSLKMDFNSIPVNIVFYGVTILATVLLSSLSYKYFETPIRNMLSKTNRHSLVILPE